MEKFTPFVESSGPMMAEVDSDELKADLFKNTPIPRPVEEKLQAFLRIRPSEEPTPHFIVKDSRTLLAFPPTTSRAFKSNNREAGGARKFNFHHIFKPDITQELFFDKCAHNLVAKFLRGESCMLFAYGTTSSGKSFTMQGNPSNPGVIPRTVNAIFTCLGDKIEKMPTFKPYRFCEAELVAGAQSRELETSIRDFITDSTASKSQSINSLKQSLTMNSEQSSELLEESHLLSTENLGLRYNIWVSFVEFYMDKVDDLLQVDDGQPLQQLMQIQDSEGNYFFKYVRHISVASEDDALRAMIYGQERLHFSETKLNKNSSRSHCNFTINLIAFDEFSKRVVRVSNLAFCDLAGSERGGRTQNAGDRIREAGRINNSLMVLGRCVEALLNNQKKNQPKMVVPFRDCKLTKMFQSYFSGTSSAAMVININPAESYYDETLVSLSFGASASKLVVSNEENRLRIKTVCNRLTQMWMQSTQRWSTFAPQRSQPSMSAIAGCSTLLNNLDEVADETLTENIERCQSTILELSTNEDIDSEHLEEYLKRIELLTEKLNAKEENEFKREAEVRAQVAAELQKVTDEMEKENLEAQEKIRLEIGDVADKKIKAIKAAHKKQMSALDKEVERLKSELFEADEKLSQHSETVDGLRTKNEEQRQEIEQLRATLQSVQSIEALRSSKDGMLSSQASSWEEERKRLEALLVESENVCITLREELEQSKSKVASLEQIQEDFENKKNAIGQNISVETSCSDLFEAPVSREVETIPLSLANTSCNTQALCTLDCNTSTTDLVAVVTVAQVSTGSGDNCVFTDDKDTSVSLREVNQSHSDEDESDDNSTTSPRVCMECENTKKQREEAIRIEKEKAEKSLRYKEKELEIFKKMKEDQITALNLKVEECERKHSIYQLTAAKLVKETKLKPAATKVKSEDSGRLEVPKDEPTRPKRMRSDKGDKNSSGEKQVEDCISKNAFASDVKRKQPLNETKGNEPEDRPARRKLPFNRTMMDSVSPIHNAEESGNEMVTRTGKKLRSRRVKNPDKKVEKKKLF